MARTSDVSLLPDGADPVSDSEEQVLDTAQLSLNFTTQESDSEARTFEVVATGEYHVKVFDVEVKACGPESKNPGKPFLAITLAIQEGRFSNSRLWTNVMLFDGALYTAAQIMKAMGRTPGKDPFPQVDELIGQDFIAVVRKQKDTYKAEKDGWTPEDGPYPMKAEVKGFKRWSEGVLPGAAPKKGAGALLP